MVAALASLQMNDFPHLVCMYLVSVICLLRCTKYRIENKKRNKRKKILIMNKHFGRLFAILIENEWKYRCRLPSYHHQTHIYCHSHTPNIHGIYFHSTINVLLSRLKNFVCSRGPASLHELGASLIMSSPLPSRTRIRPYEWHTHTTSSVCVATRVCVRPTTMTTTTTKIMCK